MPKNEDELLEMIRKAQKSGKNLDPGIYRDVPESPNEQLNNALGFPKGTIVKPVPFPKTKFDIKPSEMRPPKVTKDGLELLKKGGKIDLGMCKINTSKKNSSTPKW